MSTEGIGFQARRFGGIDRVTGHQEYVADIKLQDVLHVKLVTLDCARARIISIDSEEAERVPGVRLVLTPDQLPDPMPRFGPQYQDRPVLAVGEVKYHGDPVAAVAADTREAAEEAARLVRVQHEELPAVFSIEAALAADAPLVQDPSLRPDDPLAETNILREREFGWGDVDAQEADVVIEHTYAFPMVTHFAIEPHAFMAAPDGDGIEVWSTIQHPYLLRRMLAGLLDLPLSKVRVYAPDPGGGFGGKQNPKFEPLVAFIAMLTGRPARLVLTLEESFQAVRRSSAEIRLRTGFASDGTLVFEDFDSNFLIGAYVDIADRVVTKGNYVAGGPYRVPAVRIVNRGILSHTTPSTAFRGFGAPQVSWARESNLDEGARALGIDPLEIRLRNLAKKGEVFIPGETPADGDWEQTVRRAAELIGWDEPRAPGRGRGIAIAIKPGPTTGLSYSTVRLLDDASVLVFAGTSDMGQGARTVFAQIASQELGVPLDRIHIVMGDTSVVPYDQQTSASRSTVLMGTAVFNACQEVKSKLVELTAGAFGVEAEEVILRDGVVDVAGRKVEMREALAAGFGPLGGELVGNGEMRKDKDYSHPLSGTIAFFEFVATAIELEVDRGTGEITITRHVTVGDVGTAMNPRQVRGQDEGAAIMGLGHTLMEHYIFDDEGRVRNLGAIDYRIPTSMDLPLEMVSDSIENADGPGPYGIKGMSEGGLLAVSPAVASALADATGLVIRDLPLTPQRVWEAMVEAV